MTATDGVQKPSRSSSGMVVRFVRLAIIPLVAILGGLVVGAIIIIVSSALTGEIDFLLPFVTYANL